MMSMPSCEVRAAARRWHANRSGDPQLRATASGLAVLANLSGGKELKKPISAIDLSPHLMPPEARARKIEERERWKALEAAAARGEINPDKIEGGPVLVTASMIGG